MRNRLVTGASWVRLDRRRILANRTPRSWRTMMSIKSLAKQVPLVRSTKKAIVDLIHGDPWVGSTKLNVLTTFPMFIPGGWGNYKDRASLTIQTINQTIPFLQSLAHSIGRRDIEHKDLKAFPQTVEEIQGCK